MKFRHSKHLRKFQSRILIKLLVLTQIIVLALGWDPEMPGGMKLVINGDTFSFTTDLCSGGVFFKRPAHIQLTCFHGYFLARPNGCSMAGNRVIGGQNYVCEDVNKDRSKRIQAYIPVTNPDYPLAHTITLFDEPETLENLRRLTYLKGLEGGYEPLGYTPGGIIVTNSDKTPEVTIGNVCYQGRAQTNAGAFVADLPSPINQDNEKKMFAFGCNKNTVRIPWDLDNVQNFTEGYSTATLFDMEIKASLPDESQLTGSVSLSEKHEIWGGMAYCLQAKEMNLKNGKIKMNQLQPSIRSLDLFCPTNQRVPPFKRESRTALRPKREMAGPVETSLEFNTLMTCIASCWKDNPDKCHQPKPRVNHLPFCPPYCGGKPERPGPPLAIFKDVLSASAVHAHVNKRGTASKTSTFSAQLHKSERSSAEKASSRKSRTDDISEEEELRRTSRKWRVQGRPSNEDQPRPTKNWMVKSAFPQARSSGSGYKRKFDAPFFSNPHRHAFNEPFQREGDFGPRIYTEPQPQPQSFVPRGMGGRGDGLSHYVPDFLSYLQSHMPELISQLSRRPRRMPADEDTTMWEEGSEPGYKVAEMAGDDLYD